MQQRLRLLGSDAILDAASELFLRDGYRNTTISAIAERAGVGVATIFRHFKSKEGVLAALSRRDIDKTLAMARAALTSPSEDPAEGVLRLILPVFEMHQMPSTQIRGQTRLWLLIPTGHSETDAVVTSSDRELQELIHELLTYYRRQGRIARNIDLQDLTSIVFALFYHHYLRMALDRSLAVETVTKEFARQLPLVFTQVSVPAAVLSGPLRSYKRLPSR
ncbi:MAG TPA: helix-turn-helix domain-containing protein [Steroidobacteraceae bacterium]|nr:helix-turn-helix domain-containing protein [Steroidobacteraceae bacterium]